MLKELHNFFVNTMESDDRPAVIFGTVVPTIWISPKCRFQAVLVHVHLIIFKVVSKRNPTLSVVFFHFYTAKTMTHELQYNKSTWEIPLTHSFSTSYDSGIVYLLSACHTHMYPQGWQHVNLYKIHLLAVCYVIPYRTTLLKTASE